MDLDEMIEFDTTGEKMEAIPGCTHNIINLGDTQDLVTVRCASELFDPNHEDTFWRMYQYIWK